MNALRIFRTAAFLSAVVFLGALATSARASHPFGDVYGCRDRAVFGNTLQFYAGYGTCNGCASNYCVEKPYAALSRPYLRPVSYPVIAYDYLGRPYVIYRTSYSTFLR